MALSWRHPNTMALKLTIIEAGVKKSMQNFKAARLMREKSHPNYERRATEHRAAARGLQNYIDEQK